MLRLEDVLWVEDQQEFVDSLTPILERFCSRVDRASDATAAEVALTKKNYQLILLDLQLPPENWGGLELLRRLGPRTASTPIIVLSGAGALSHCIEALRLGAMDYVEKENARKDLVAVVEKVIGEFRAQQPLDDYARVRDLEQALKDLLLTGMRQQAEAEGKSMFKEFVPKKVALKSYERWLDGDSGGQEDYLDLLDWATIIDSLWQKLEVLKPLHKVVAPKNRDDRTKWLVDLNEARKLIAHPVRGELSEALRLGIGRAEEIVSQWRLLLSAS